VHRPDGDPREDLDLASYGIVKVYEDRLGTTYPDLPWEPKAAFAALAGCYRDLPPARSGADGSLAGQQRLFQSIALPAAALISRHAMAASPPV
jgi:hypothetical protein